MARIIKARKSPTQKAYSKEVTRIKRAIKRLEQRGYIFEKQPFKEATRPTKASITKLEKLTTAELYKKAKFTTPEGKKISGEERRKQERSESAKKGVETRQRKKAYEEQREKFKQWTQERYGEPISESPYTPPLTATNVEPDESELLDVSEYVKMEQKQFEAEQRIKDEEAKRRLREEEEYRQRFSQGKIIYDQIMDMIYEIDIQFQRSADSLRHALEREFERYGEDKVLMSMAEVEPDFLETCRRALTYLPEDERHVKAITHLHELITGEALSIEEAQRIHDEVDSDSYENEI